jgi:hypothetical protein
MRRSILFALLGLLLSNAAAFSQARAVPRSAPRVVPRVRPPLVSRPPFPVIVPLVAVPWFGAPSTPVFSPYWAVSPWTNPSWAFVNPFLITPWPTYLFVGSTASAHPQLIFNDGTTYTVRDYWRVDDQLLFITIEEGATKTVEHTVPFSDLDVERTTDADAARGFRFVLRDEPIEQWLRNHGSALGQSPR